MDSRKYRDGDAATFLPGLKDTDFVFLSPDLGETRAYNQLVRFARGKLLFITQDDIVPEEGDCTWLSNAATLFKTKKNVGLVGLDRTSIFGLSCGEDSKLFEVTPRCTFNGFKVEAVLCASLGPLFIRRDVFVSMGGFNETLSDRSTPSSLLDCEISARMWRQGYAVVSTGMKRDKTICNGGGDSPAKTVCHTAWKTMDDALDLMRCRWIKDLLHGDGLDGINLAVRKINSQFDCQNWQTLGSGCPTAKSTAHGFNGEETEFDCAGTDNAYKEDCGISDANCHKISSAKSDLILTGTHDKKMATDVSFIMQYWGGGKMGVSKPKWHNKSLSGLKRR